MLNVPRGTKSTLDHCYTILKDAYHSVPRAALGLYDHCMLHLLPNYRQKFKSAEPVVKTVKRWTTESKLVLHACFDCTEAAATDLDKVRDTVISYTSFCEDVCADQNLMHIQQH